MCIHMCIFIYTCVCIYVYVYRCICVYMYMCMDVCLYIGIHVHSYDSYAYRCMAEPCTNITSDQLPSPNSKQTHRPASNQPIHQASTNRARKNSQQPNKQKHQKQELTIQQKDTRPTAKLHRHERRIYSTKYLKFAST